MSYGILCDDLLDHDVESEPVPQLELPTKRRFNKLKKGAEQLAQNTDETASSPPLRSQRDEGARTVRDPEINGEDPGVVDVDVGVDIDVDVDAEGLVIVDDDDDDVE